jgi:tetratricopeptide (TPR) repeat protein
MRLPLNNKKSLFFVIGVIILIVLVVGIFLLIQFKIIKLGQQNKEYFLEVTLTPEQHQELLDRESKNFEMLKLFPKNYEVYMDLGNIERELGNASKAIEYFEKAWEIIPTNSTPWLNIGNIYIRLGFYEKAEEAFLKAIDTNNSYYLTYYNLAKLYNDFLTAKSEKVRGVYLEGLKNTNNDYQLLYHFTEYLIETKNYSEALQYLQVLLSVSPNQEKQAVSVRIGQVKELLNQSLKP